MSAVETHINFSKLFLPVLSCFDFQFLSDITSEKVSIKKHLLMCQGEKSSGSEGSFGIALSGADKWMCWMSGLEFTIGVSINICAIICTDTITIELSPIRQILVFFSSLFLYTSFPHKNTSSSYMLLLLGLDWNNQRKSSRTFVIPSKYS